MTKEVMDAITVYYNFLIPAFPDGKTPAEAYGARPSAWMRPIIAGYKEKPDKLEIAIAAMDRHNEILRRVLDQLNSGAITPTTTALGKIVEGLKRYGPAERPGRHAGRRPETTTKSGIPPGEFEGTTFVIPFLTLFGVKNVKKARRKLRDFGRRAEEMGYNIREDEGGSFAVFKSEGSIGTKLGTINFLPDGIVSVGTLTTARKNALHVLLKDIMKEDITLLKELERVELPPP